jgi:hypothetical protein
LILPHQSRNYGADVITEFGHLARDSWREVITELSNVEPLVGSPG